MKKISYKILSYSEGWVCFFIDEQTHIGREFSFGGEFKSFEGYILCSSLFPSQCHTEDNKIFVRGRVKERNFDMLQLNISEFLKFAKSVKEYNEYYKESK